MEEFQQEMADQEEELVVLRVTKVLVLQDKDLMVDLQMVVLEVRVEEQEKQEQILHQQIEQEALFPQLEQMVDNHQLQEHQLSMPVEVELVVEMHMEQFTLQDQEVKEEEEMAHTVQIQELPVLLTPEVEVGLMGMIGTQLIITDMQEAQE